MVDTLVSVGASCAIQVATARHRGRAERRFDGGFGEPGVVGTKLRSCSSAPRLEEAGTSGLSGGVLPVGRVARYSVYYSMGVDVDNGSRECFRSFLKQIVPYAPVMPRCEYLREFLGVGTGIRMWRTIRIAFEGDGGNDDDGALDKPLLQIVIPGLACGHAKAPAIIVDDDVDVIGVVERCSAAIERGIVGVSLRRSELPDELR